MISHSLGDDIEKKILLCLQFKARVSDILKPHQDDYYLQKWLKGI